MMLARRGQEIGNVPEVLARTERRSRARRETHVSTLAERQIVSSYRRTGSTDAIEEASESMRYEFRERVTDGTLAGSQAQAFFQISECPPV
jgi:hypothetical protein